MKEKVIVHYRTSDGETKDWVCEYERLDQILKVCEEKGFEIIGVEQLV